MRDAFRSCEIGSKQRLNFQAVYDGFSYDDGNGILCFRGVKGKPVKLQKWKTADGDSIKFPEDGIAPALVVPPLPDADGTDRAEQDGTDGRPRVPGVQEE